MNIAGFVLLFFNFFLPYWGYRWTECTCVFQAFSVGLGCIPVGRRQKSPWYDSWVPTHPSINCVCSVAAVRITMQHISWSRSAAELAPCRCFRADGIQQGHLVTVRQPDRVHLFWYSVKILRCTWLRPGVRGQGGARVWNRRGSSGTCVERWRFLPSIGWRSSLLLQRWI